ncbi:MAG: intradiol ring-cleavage dioxygenase [Gemmatimonadota bacterium]|nr:intradiol ring-cleavage dioxygenase [Gemmatimonadota bacterium]
MHHDDEQVGRILSRREALGLIGVGGAAALGTPSALGGSDPAPFRLPACVVRPEQTEGPYFIDERLDRVDIRSDPTDGVVKPGTPFNLAIQVSHIGSSGCRPLAGALVDVWQCDALGEYAGVKDIINDLFDNTGRKFLRGYQVTDEEGMARFTTIYPGWYEGRAVHIHFKIRTDPDAESGTEFTSQLYFDDGLSDRVLAAAPYTAHEGDRPRNEDDGIYRNSGGHQLVLDVHEDGDGFAATFDIGLNLT